MEPEKTLVFLDEIQAFPEARTAIKFLVEDGRFDYIESGSLLGAKFKEVRSYPVGFEELYYMYPMSLEEYLWVNGVQKSTVEYLKKCLRTISRSQSLFTRPSASCFIPILSWAECRMRFRPMWTPTTLPR